MTEEEKKEELKRLYHQLDVCGQILADWDEEKPPTYYRCEYRKILKQLAKLEPENFPMFKKDNSRINEHIKAFCEKNKCPKCGGELKQTRIGAFRVICLSCNTKFQFKHKHC